jgi:hypothetical protein
MAIKQALAVKTMEAAAGLSRLIISGKNTEDKK